MIYGTTTNDLYGHSSRALRSTGLTDSAEGLLNTGDRLQQAVVDDVLQSDRQLTLDVCVREGGLWRKPGSRLARQSLKACRPFDRAESVELAVNSFPRLCHASTMSLR